MEVLVEIILSLLVEGSAAGVTSRKVPRAVRVLLGAFLLLPLWYLARLGRALVKR